MDPALLVFAFAAGAASFFSPCCVAMLPAYVGYAARPSRSTGPEGAAAPDPHPGATGSLQGRAGHVLAFAGLAPFTAGLVPLLVLGLGAFGLTPTAWDGLLPRSDVSILMTVGGAMATAAGLALAGKGATAARGALFGVLATAGFFAVFLPVGLPIAFLARGLAPYLSWVAVGVGATLALLGATMLAGKMISVPLPALQGDVSSPKGFFLFGAGYGLAGLSCTFPVFLAVVGAGVVAGGFASALAVLAAYALGKGSLLVGITVVSVAGGASVGRGVHRAAPYVSTASALLLIGGGGYIAWYFGQLLVGGP